MSMISDPPVSPVSFITLEQTQTEESAPANNNKIIIITIAFAVPIIIAVAMFGKSILFPVTRDIDAPIPTTRIVTSAPTFLPTTPIAPAEDAVWVSYRNTKYNYSFQYPAAYFILPQNNPELSSVAVSSYVAVPDSLDSQYKLDIVYSGKKDDTETLEQYLTRTHAEEGGAVTLKQIVLGKTPAYMTSSNKKIYLEHSNNVFLVNTYPFSRSSITNKILGSFEFNP